MKYLKIKYNNKKSIYVLICYFMCIFYVTDSYSGGVQINDVLLNGEYPSEILVEPNSSVTMTYSFNDYSYSGNFNKIRHFIFIITFESKDVPYHSIFVQNLERYSEESTLYNGKATFTAPSKIGKYTIKYCRLPLYLERSILTKEFFYYKNSLDIKNQDYEDIQAHIKNNRQFMDKACTFLVNQSLISKKLLYYKKMKKNLPEIFIKLNDKWFINNNCKIDSSVKEVKFSWKLSNIQYYKDIKLRYRLYPFETKWSDWFDPRLINYVTYNNIDRSIQNFQAQILYTDRYNIKTKSSPAYMKVTFIEPFSKGSKVYSIDTTPNDLRNLDSIKVNGKNVNFVIKKSNKISFLGKDEIIKKGLNILETIKKKYIFWCEKEKLSLFKNPYKNSHAVIIAIDDYDRKNVPHKNKTGFKNLDYMIDNAKQLKEKLVKVGFEPNNIKSFFNHEANSTAINNYLKSYWEGGKNDTADRLLIYFGGHGNSLKNIGYLVTYDFDPTKPTLTSLLMKDLTNRHAENISAHHVMIALDACHSGLAVYKTLSRNKVDNDKLREFRTLSIIQNDTAPPARNILLAGTGNQEVIWDKGGIFTKALVSGLGGRADFNNDNIIQFEELSNYVRNEVAYEAKLNNASQEVAHYNIENLGKGRIMFFLYKFNTD